MQIPRLPERGTLRDTLCLCEKVCCTALADWICVDGVV